mgnify:CR=1 FL=1
MEIAILALGCFWGPEVKFSKLDGILKTEVGYCGGNSSETNYKEVCTGSTNHAEVVKLEFDPELISYEKIIVSLIALVGMYFIANGNKLQVFHINKLGHYEWAIVYGVLSSFLASVFTIMNGKISQQIEPAVLSFVEMLAGGLCLLLFTLLFLDFDFIHEINFKNGLYILILSFLCTNVPFLLSIYALKKLEAFVVTLTVNLEPIYGLFFAAILFQEFTAFRPEFYLGAGFILLSVFLPIIIGKWKRSKTSS